MITDAQLRLSSAQPITGATIVSTNTEDLLSAYRNLGRGQVMRGRVQADIPFVGGTSLQVNYIQSPNPDLSGATVLISGPVVPLASLIAGAVLLDVPLPTNTQRCVGFQYVPVGTFTGGTVSAFLLSDTDYQPYVPSNTGY